MSTPLLDVQCVSKHYAGHTALDSVSLSIARGRVFGLLGPNGAGKTSLIRIINGITAPDSGRVLLDGQALSLREASQRIGYLPEERGLYRKMRVGEHALYLARLRGLGRQEALTRLRYWFDRLDIMAWWHKRVEELSKGMQQKVQFVCTVIHEPELLIFDEPFSGFDPVNAELLKREILDLRTKGHTIIFSTHNMQSVEEVCDDVAMIHRARLVLSGTVTSIRLQRALPRVAITVHGQLDPQTLETLAPEVYHFDGERSHLRLSLGTGEDLRTLLWRLPEQYHILSAEREVPSMHEIFLNTVATHGQ